MIAVRMQLAREGARVELFGEVIHRCAGPQEARRVADWVRYQLRRGLAPAQIRAALAGTPMESAGDGILLAEARACHGLLGGSLAELRQALDSGAVDRDVGALIEAERLGAGRPEVLRLLSAHRRPHPPVRQG